MNSTPNCQGVSITTSSNAKRPGYFITPEFAGASVTCSFEKDHDHPIKEVQKDNKRILQYELIGLSENDLTVKKEFLNRQKETYLNVTGSYKDELTEFENDISIHLYIDTDTYDSYDCHIENGILTITLYEIINEQPKFERK